ncbi:MAG TPA: hypothetical protein ENJ28_03585 [Gammaproteobacteria bacterium]|nr:hypothetical protein [Gammaproteobacteria bacterium]
MSNHIHSLLEEKTSKEIHEWMAAGKLGDEGSRNRDIANNILKAREKEEENTQSLLRDQREEETLSIAKEANRIAYRALRATSIDRIIAIIALITAIIAAKDEILTLIQ